LLIDRLLRSPGSRVVTVTSAAYRYGRLDFRNLNPREGNGYSAFRAYARSKRANFLFAQELQRRLLATETISVAAHPGGAATDLGRRATERRIYRVCLPLFERLSQSADEGARSVLRAATCPDLIGGELIAPGGFLGMRGWPVVKTVEESGMDAVTAKRLWAASEELTGIRFL
jgi:NAD(P)-dependent dehydrogenase (short-subunit alcohol dehydrogenase family)